MSSRSWRAWALSWHGGSCLRPARRPSRCACPAAQGWRRPRGNGMNGGLAMRGGTQLRSARAVQCAALPRRHSVTGRTTVVSPRRVGAPRACCGWLAQGRMNRAAKRVPLPGRSPSVRDCCTSQPAHAYICMAPRTNRQGGGCAGAWGTQDGDAAPHAPRRRRVSRRIARRRA